MRTRFHKKAENQNGPLEFWGLCYAAICAMRAGAGRDRKFIKGGFLRGGAPIDDAGRFALARAVLDTIDYARFCAEHRRKHRTGYFPAPPWTRKA